MLGLAPPAPSSAPSGNDSGGGGAAASVGGAAAAASTDAISAAAAGTSSPFGLSSSASSAAAAARPSLAAARADACAAPLACSQRRGVNGVGPLSRQQPLHMPHLGGRCRLFDHRRRLRRRRALSGRRVGPPRRLRV